MRPINILALDGGGIKGIIPIMLLDYLERTLSRYYPSYYLHQYFDIIGGTSTGGLIALGMSTPLLNRANSMIPKYSAQSLLSLYTQKGSLLFKRINTSWLSKLSPLYTFKYSTDFISNLMEELYGDSTLEDALTPLLITAFDIQSMQPHIFKSHNVRQDPYQENFYIKDVARATSAAPSFFPAAKISSCPPHNKTYGLIDGGVFANNPALLTLLEARKRYPKATSFNIISLGTGFTKNNYRIDDIQKWGIYQWMSPTKDVPLLKILMSGQSETVHYTLKNLDIVNYFRFDIPLNHKHAGLDNVSKDNINYLQKTSLDYIKIERKTIHACIDLLLRHR